MLVEKAHVWVELRADLGNVVVDCLHMSNGHRSRMGAVTATSTELVLQRMDNVLNTR